MIRRRVATGMISAVDSPLDELGAQRHFWKAAITRRSASSVGKVAMNGP